MSKSVKVTPRFTDLRDRAYLSILGTSHHQQMMEKARVRVQTFELPGFERIEESVPFLPGVSEASPSQFTPALTGQQRKVLDQLGQACRSLGYRPHIEALPSSTGGIVMDLRKDSREKVYVRKEG